MTAPVPPRVATLDFVRGVAVMGILLANLPSFGLPEAAYFSPAAWGGHGPADTAAWYATYLLIEGKFRGLFTLLFGASLLLVTDAAERGGRSAAGAHFGRMAVLFGVGCLHLYLVWWGDILAHYALVGTVALAFRKLGVRALLACAAGFLLLDMAIDGGAAITLFASAARNTAESVATWNSFAASFGVPPRADLLAEIAAVRDGWWTGVRWRWIHAGNPFSFALLVGPETLSAMLLGMAGYRSGLLTGAWPRARTQRWGAACLALSLPVYAALGINTWAHGFDQRQVFLASIALVAPFRLLACTGYACVLVLLFRPGGRLSERVAAVGRAAFTNYLGTSLVMLALFTGARLFGRLSRAELYLLAPPVWLLMLAWSKPWLARFRFGPLEWLWRTLARGRFQPMGR